MRTLYDLLLAHYPTTGVRVARAAARLEAGDAQAAWLALEAIDEGEVRSYQPYWVTRGHVLLALQRHGEAARALELAIGLSEDPAVRAFLLEVRRSASAR